jgi:hypothetical protein
MIHTIHHSRKFRRELKYLALALCVEDQGYN